MAELTPEARAFLNQMAETSKTTLLQYEELPLMLLAEGTKGVRLYTLFDVPSNPIARQRLCYHLGASTPMNARRKEVGTLLFVGMAMEAWKVVRRKEDYNPYERAADAPDRIEALCVSVLDVATGQQHAVDYEMLRNRRGHLKDLLRQEEPINTSNVLLEMFVGGWRGEPLEEAPC